MFENQVNHVYDLTDASIQELVKKQPEQSVVCKAKSEDGLRCQLCITHRKFQSSHMSFRPDGTVAFYQ
jgi:hypothetical protein